MTTSPVVFVLKGYPRLSETFVAAEILGLERRGFDLRLVALRRPTDDRVHPVHREVRAPVDYMPEYLHRDLPRLFRSAWTVRRSPGLATACRSFLRDLRRDPSRNRVRRFGQALVLAAELPSGTSHLHAHFIHTPASVVRYAAMITGLSWSCSAHAKDIWTTSDWDLRDKLEGARWTVTCTAAGRARLDALSPPGKPVQLLYHGLALDRFGTFVRERAVRDGRDPEDPIRLLAVGRAVEKKGFDLLLDALAALPPTLAWRLTHVGAGPLLGALRARAEAHGLGGRIAWLGPQDQHAVLAQYRDSDLFVLPCRIAEDGDRDGLPNVIVEAQSQGLACLSTTVGGVPELIVDGVNGRLVAPDDVGALTEALSALVADPVGRAAMGRAGQARVVHAFDAAATLDRLAELFGGGTARGSVAKAAE